MPKSYYVFIVLISVFFFGCGFVSSSLFYCSKDCVFEKDLNSISMREVKGSSSQSESCDIFVDISGAVMNPRVVCLSEGSILDDAIKMVGGFNPQSYSFKYVAQKINLAALLEPEEKVYIPYHDDVVCNFVEDPQVQRSLKVVSLISGDSKVAESSDVKDDGSQKVVESKESTGGCININTDSQSRLMELSGVGETRAKDIIEGRPYSKVEEIKNVKGIGDATFEKVKDLICV